MSFDDKNQVCVSGCSEYDENRLTTLMDRLFQTLGIYRQLKPGMKVVIKPNLLMDAKPDSAVITHPAVAAAVVSCVKKTGARILIAESSGGPFNGNRMRKIFSVCGYTELAARLNVELYTACQSREVRLPLAKRCKSMHIVEPFLTADYIINICKLKTHGMMGMSAAVKNMFGAVPGLMKPELHCRFPEKSDFAAMIVDLCSFLQPQLNVMDAIDAMEGNGPTGGEKRFIGAVLASFSPYAMDLAGARIIGAEPRDLPISLEAIERGLVCPEIGDLEILCDELTQFCVSDFKPAKSASADFLERAPVFLQPMLRKLARPTPKIRPKDCIGCGKCAQSCPQHIIEIKDRKARIMPKRCICCFCCHEMCPARAIDIKRFGVFKL